MNKNILQPSKTIWLSPKKSQAEKQEKYRVYLKELAQVRNQIRLLIKNPSENLRTEVIRRLNDLLRVHHYGGRVMMTQGVASLNPLDQIDVLDSLAEFNNFTEDNDPYKEHDYATFDVEHGGTYQFKIDYYDNDIKYHSPDNADPSVTTRIMIITTPSEY